MSSENDYKEYIESSPTALFVADQEGKYIFVNDAATDLVGFSKEELLNMTIVDLTPKEDLETTMKDFTEAKKTGRLNKEYRLNTKDGDPVDIQLNAKMLNNGNVMAFCENISHIKDVERKLEKKVKELEIMNNAMANRELRMVELKQEIKQLKNPTNES